MGFSSLRGIQDNGRSGRTNQADLPGTGASLIAASKTGEPTIKQIEAKLILGD
jgi:hypothetical protein